MALKRFANNEEVENWVDDYFEELDGSHHKQLLKIAGKSVSS